MFRGKLIEGLNMTRVTKVVLEVKKIKINNRMKKFGNYQLRIRVNTPAMEKGFFLYDKTFFVEEKKSEFRAEARRVAEYYKVPFRDYT